MSCYRRETCKYEKPLNCTNSITFHKRLKTESINYELTSKMPIEPKHDLPIRHVKRCSIYSPIHILKPQMAHENTCSLYVYF